MNTNDLQLRLLAILLERQDGILRTFLFETTVVKFYEIADN